MSDEDQVTCERSLRAIVAIMAIPIAEGVQSDERSAALSKYLASGFPMNMLKSIPGEVGQILCNIRLHETVEIKFKGKTDWAHRAVFIKRNGECALAIAQEACGVCLGESVYEGLPCDFCYGAGFVPTH